MVSSFTFTSRMGYTFGRMRLLKPQAPTCSIQSEFLPFSYLLQLIFAYSTFSEQYCRVSERIRQFKIQSRSWLKHEEPKSRKRPRQQDVLKSDPRTSQAEASLTNQLFYRTACNINTKEHIDNPNSGRRLSNLGQVAKIKDENLSSRLPQIDFPQLADKDQTEIPS